MQFGWKNSSSFRYLLVIALAILSLAILMYTTRLTIGALVKLDIEDVIE